MSRAYRDGRDGGLYTGGGSFTDYLTGQNEAPPQHQPNGGGGNGCGYILIFLIVIQILIAVLPIAIPMVISALFMTIILNTIDQKVLLPASLTFGKGFKAVFYTYLWYFVISFFVSSIVLFILTILTSETESSQIRDFISIDLANTQYGNTDFYKLCLILFFVQIPIFLIAGAIFRYYISKYLGKIKVSYWRATFFISLAVVIWMVITGIEFYLWIKYSPETFESVTKMYQDFLR